MQQKRNYGRIVHWMFTIFLLCLSLYLSFRSGWHKYELTHVYGVTNYYADIIDKTSRPGFDTQRAADSMVYAYAMRAPFDTNNPLVELLRDRNEHFAMLLITERLARETGENYGEDFDLWIEKFASEESVRAYFDSKESREEHGENANPLKRQVWE